MERWLRATAGLEFQDGSGPPATEVDRHESWLASELGLTPETFAELFGTGWTPLKNSSDLLINEEWWMAPNIDD